MRCAWVGGAPDAHQGANVLVVLPPATARPRGKRIADVAQQPVRRLGHAHDRTGRIEGAAVDRQDVLHRRGEGRVAVGGMVQQRFSDTFATGSVPALFPVPS